MKMVRVPHEGGLLMIGIVYFCTLSRGIYIVSFFFSSVSLVTLGDLDLWACLAHV